MGIFNKQLCSLLILGLFLVIALSLVSGTSLIEGHSKHNKNASKAISHWQKNNKKKMQSMIDGISSTSDAAATIPKLLPLFDLDDTASKASKLSSGGGVFGSFGGGGDDDSDTDRDTDTDSDNDSDSFW